MRRSRLLKDRLRRQAVLTTKGGETFTGIVFDLDDRAWVLHGVEAIGAGGAHANIHLDGELVVLAGDIAYIQMP